MQTCNETRRSMEQTVAIGSTPALEWWLVLDVLSAWHAWEWVLAVLIVAITSLLYRILFVPLNRVKHLEDVGFQHLEDVYRGYQGKKKAEMVNDIRRQLEAGDMPPAYPNGWFAIFESDDLPCGEVRSIQALGMNLALF
ncbi:unnamed protein product, partial [Darwinula stevensoni]